MNYFVFLFAALNLYSGTWFFLNAIGVLQISKYSLVANSCFAVLLSAAALVSIYLSVVQGRHTLALLIDIGPWLITLLLVIGSLIFGNTR